MEYVSTAHRPNSFNVKGSKCKRYNFIAIDLMKHFRKAAVLNNVLYFTTFLTALNAFGCDLPP
jgi:hypothetical protein